MRKWFGRERVAQAKSPREKFCRGSLHWLDSAAERCACGVLKTASAGISAGTATERANARFEIVVSDIDRLLEDVLVPVSSPSDYVLSPDISEHPHAFPWFKEGYLLWLTADEFAIAVREYRRWARHRSIVPGGPLMFLLMEKILQLLSMAEGKARNAEAQASKPDGAVGAQESSSLSLRSSPEGVKA